MISGGALQLNFSSVGDNIFSFDIYQVKFSDNLAVVQGGAISYN